MVKIQPFAFVTSKYSYKTFLKDVFDSNKQLTSTMPNLIHSLDATSLALLHDQFRQTDKNINIFTIHDCFAVTCNNVEKLITLLKIYLKIYSDSIYLEELDKYIRTILINNFGRDIFSENGKYVIITDKNSKNKDLKIPFPDIHTKCSK